MAFYFVNQQKQNSSVVAQDILAERHEEFDKLTTFSTIKRFKVASRNFAEQFTECGNQSIFH